MKVKCVYPIVLSPGEEYIVVYVPDFDINTQGKDMADAIEMARDAIGIVGIDMEDEEEALPVPSEVAAVRKDRDDEIVTLVDIDFAEYRRKNDLRSVKKNCTIPSWLNFEAEKAGINFYAVLQTALKDELKSKAPGY